MSGQPFLPLYGGSNPPWSAKNERVMIERIEKEDIETQIYKDIFITNDDDRKNIFYIQMY